MWLNLTCDDEIGDFGSSKFLISFGFEPEEASLVLSCTEHPEERIALSELALSPAKIVELTFPISKAVKLLCDNIRIWTQKDITK